MLNEVTVKLILSNEDMQKVEEIANILNYSNDKALCAMMETGWNSHFFYMYENAKLCYDKDYREKSITRIITGSGENDEQTL